MSDPVTQAPTGSEPTAPASVGASLYPNGGDNPTPNAAPLDPATGKPVEAVAPTGPTGPVIDPAGVTGSTAPSGSTAPTDATAPTAPTGPVEAKVEEVKPPIDPTTYDIKLPKNVTVDDVSMTQFKTVASELGLDNASAQKVMDILPTVLAKQVEAITSANQQAFNETQTKWVAEVNAMPEFQGEAKSNTLAILGRAMDEFGSPEAREFLNVTGAGNNPHVIKYILSLANALMEGTPAANGGVVTQAKGNRSLGQRLYPDLQS